MKLPNWLSWLRLGRRRSARSSSRSFTNEEWQSIPQELVQIFDDMKLTLTVDEHRAALILFKDDEYRERLYIIRYDSSCGEKAYQLNRYVQNKEGDIVPQASHMYSAEGVREFFDARRDLPGYSQRDLPEVPPGL